MADGVAGRAEQPTEPGLDLFSLSGRVALVTGGARGLGEEIACGLARAGADVAICDLLEDAGAAVAREIEHLGRRSLFGRVDVTSSAEIEAFLDEVVALLGPVDILVNNAGIESEGVPIEDVPDEVWDRIIGTNLSSMFRVTRAVGRRMIERGQGGVVINMSSISGLIISKIFPRHNIAYGVSKAGVAHLTRGLASEWAHHGIRVNAIAPGYMLTANTATSRKYPEIVERLIEMTPMKRYGEPWELCGAAIFLASEASSFMTGQVVVVDGGNTVW
jgi:NAD(P)-dependent dehydrogenase (short-subunit alcohol dehydrogenase family)